MIPEAGPFDKEISHGVPKIKFSIKASQLGLRPALSIRKSLRSAFKSAIIRLGHFNVRMPKNASYGPPFVFGPLKVQQVEGELQLKLKFLKMETAIHLRRFLC